MTDERFRRAEEEYLRLRGELDAGRITVESFESALQAAMIEHGGRWWMLGANSGAWYVHDGAAWTDAAPPAGETGSGGPPVVADRSAASDVAGGRGGRQAGSGGAVAAPRAAPRTAMRSPPWGAAATVLRGLLGLSLALGSAGVALAMQAMSSGDWERAEVAHTAVVAASFLLGLTAVPLWPAVPWGVIAAGFGFTALIGLLALNGVRLPMPGFVWWFPDVLFACGLAGILGSAIGFAISRGLGRNAR